MQGQGWGESQQDIGVGQIEIRIEQADLLPQLRQCDTEVDGYVAFSHTPLATGNRNDPTCLTGCAES